MHTLVSSSNEGESAVYLLNCSVCNGQYTSRQKWVEHLAQFGHQNLARKHFQLGNSADWRKCSLVIFTTYDLTEQCARKVIQYFGRDHGATPLVTDFVWWEDRPRFGIIQFESRKKAKQVLLEIQKTFSRNDHIPIDNQGIQVKEACDLLDLELKAILPGNNPGPFPVASKCHQRLSKGTESVQNDNHHHRWIQNGENTLSDDDNQENENLTLSPVDSRSGQVIYQEFGSMNYKVKIPDHHYKQVKEMCRVLTKVLLKWVPSIQTSIFRNWYLKLKNSSVSEGAYDPLLIYVYANDPPPGQDNPPGNFTWLPGRLLQRYLSNSPVFTCTEKSFPEPSEDSRLGCKFIHGPTGRQFQIVNCKRFIVEVQACQLFKYCCDFDLKIRRVLALARYWSIVNDVNFGESKVSPKPYSLDWLILTFFIHKKYVPSVRSILARPHRPIIEYDYDESGTDVGFCADVEYCREWRHAQNVSYSCRESYHLTTLQTFQNFLEFCCTQIFDQGGVIINPKDGEILKRDKLFNGQIISKLSSEEVKILQLQENSSNSSSNWYMIHPFITSWRFSAPKKNMEPVIAAVTRKTNERLKTLIKLIKDKGAEIAFQLCGTTLCEIMKVDQEIPAIDHDHPIPSRPSKKRRIDSN